MIPNHLKIQSGQETLTPEQEAEARRFAEERIATQLSTEPVDEPEAEALLRQAYQVAGLPPPEHIHWLDGPLQFVAVLAPLRVEESSGASGKDSVWASVGTRVGSRVEYSIRASIGAWEDILERHLIRVWTCGEDTVWDSVKASVSASVGDCIRLSVEEAGGGYRSWESIMAYSASAWLTRSRFFDVYLAPNDLHALAHFNELISGYWLGKKESILVRRPRLLARDAEGRLHSETGKAVEYHDGWGFYAWHGVRVSEHVMLAPEQLTRQDFLNEQNMEVRRVIQERMGARFVPELGGVALDSGPRGTLYEVRLPEDDPERIARYVQVQDASSERRYLLRVPPTIQTAAEAVAWTFQIGVEVYRPAQET